jgi:hypothetical protein
VDDRYALHHAARAPYHGRRVLLAREATIAIAIVVALSVFASLGPKPCDVEVLRKPVRRVLALRAKACFREEPEDLGVLPSRRRSRSPLGRSAKCRLRHAPSRSHSSISRYARFNKRTSNIGDASSKHGAEQPGDALPMRRVRARCDVLGARGTTRAVRCAFAPRGTWSSRRARRPRRDRRARNVGPMARARRTVSCPRLTRCQRGGESPRLPGESRIVTAIFGHQCVFSAGRAPQKV